MYSMLFAVTMQFVRKKKTAIIRIHRQTSLGDTVMRLKDKQLKTKERNSWGTCGYHVTRLGQINEQREASKGNSRFKTWRKARHWKDAISKGYKTGWQSLTKTQQEIFGGFQLDCEEDAYGHPDSYR